MPSSSFTYCFKFGFLAVIVFFPFCYLQVACF
jgi:hypothetical protein